MSQYSPALMIDILRREYPEIESRIRQRIYDTIPQKLNDLSLIPQIISSFKSIKGIDDCGWISMTGSREAANENRELLLAVILLLYNPEKIMRLTEEKTRYGLLRKISAVLGGKIGIWKYTLPSAIVAFKAYKSFKEETYRLYELIKAENSFFEE